MPRAIGCTPTIPTTTRNAKRRSRHTVSRRVLKPSQEESGDSCLSSTQLGRKVSDAVPQNVGSRGNPPRGSHLGLVDCLGLRRPRPDLFQTLTFSKRSGL